VTRNELGAGERGIRRVLTKRLRHSKLACIPFQDGLPCLLIAFVVEVQGPPMATGPFAQPRRSERRPQRLSVTLLVKAGGHEFELPAHSHDVSQHGLRIRTDSPFDEARRLNPGQTVYVYGVGDVGLGHCRVVWVHTDRPDSRSEAGLEFLN
jgi:hypothetical protein